MDRRKPNVIIDLNPGIHCSVGIRRKAILYYANNIELLRQVRATIDEKSQRNLPNLRKKKCILFIVLQK